jgi:hypothetical protein
MHAADMYTSETSAPCAATGGCTFLRLLLEHAEPATHRERAGGARRVSLMRAAELAELAVVVGHAQRGSDGQYILGPGLQLSLARLGARRLGDLTLDQAAAVERSLDSRRTIATQHATTAAAETVRVAARPHEARSLRGRGLSQTAVARSIGVHRSTIARWESGA